MNNRTDNVRDGGSWARASRTVSVTAKLSTGALAAMAVGAAWGIDGDAHAARKASNLQVQKVNVMSLNNVPANQIVEVTLSGDVDPGTVSPASVQVRAQNATGTGYTKQVFGSFQVAGNLIRFFPRLPGHLRDATGNFYGEGSVNDNATENAGFQAGTKYEIRLIGNPLGSPIRGVNGRPLNRSTFSRFTIATAANANQLYTTRSYSDSPPPQFSFSNPPDTVPIPDTQYATRGGTKGVPNEISVQIFCARVPLSPTTARVPGNVAMTMLERYGNPSLRRPAPGSVFIEQNFETTLLVYKPTFPLADQGLYSLRISKNLKDLTEQYDFQPNRERDRLRRIYEHLSTQRANNPGTPPADLPDPPASLVGDWPPVTDTAARGVLKTNLLALGDAHPDEIDPRTMLIFTSRDEPVTPADFRLEFLRSENLFDPLLSTAEWDLGVPGAASAIFTVAGGSAVNGDLLPTTSLTLNAALVPNYTYNFRDVVIPQGVVVTVSGTRPVTMKAINFTLNGIIDLPGAAGSRSSEGSVTTVNGGLGGPGGGQGGSASYASTNNLNPTNAQRASGITGGSGRAGVDSDGGNPSTFGGGGGLGGKMASGTYYGYSGGGGGGGGRTAGKAGGAGTGGGGTFGASWNGAGGNGGAGSSNVELNPLVGGGGGGAGPGGGFGYGGTNGWGTTSWFGNGGSGGGGGGAVLIQTAKVLTIGTSGVIRARGGKGADQLAYNGGASGPGGGGGGGSVLLRSTGGFNVQNGLAFDVSGGLGGNGTSGYPTKGGDGGTGFIRAEEPTGTSTITVANGTTGAFDPVGAGVPSFVYSKWADLGVQDPRILPWTNADIATNPTTNDAVYVMVQMTKEDASIFGTPDVTKVDANQNSKDTSITSPWLPIKIHDKTGLPGTGAFAPPGYDPGVHGLEYSGFPVDQINNRGFRFIRFRVYFQLDALQQRSDPMPSVDFITTHMQFNL